MSEAVPPSVSFWEDIGFDVKQILGTRAGPKQQKGVTGWTTDAYRAVTAATGEITLPADIPRRSIPGLILRNAPRTARLLTLLDRYSREVPRSALLPSVELAGLAAEDLSRRLLVLALYLKNPDFLVASRYRSLTGGFQSARPFITDKSFAKQRLTSSKFKSDFERRLRNIPEFAGRRLSLDRVETLRRDEAVTLYVKHEGDRKRVTEFDRIHWDSPLHWAVITYYPQSRALEVRTRQRSLLDGIVKAAGLSALSREDAYRPVRKGETFGDGDSTDSGDREVTIDTLTLRSIEAEGVQLTGSPTVRVRGTDLSDTVRQLVTDKGIDLTTSVVSWEARVRFTHDGITNESTVGQRGKQAEVTFRPPPPYPVKRLIYRMIRGGKLPPLPE